MKNKKFPVFILLFLCITKLSAQDIPYSPDITTQLKDQLVAALKAKGNDYQPKTANICSNGQPCFTNRLILEDSPYLLQHAHNPINWFAWGKEALAKAKKENKPIFLSIGYASCHWCHRMEKESFDNVQIANILNQHFIAIKVDRERRPDIDEFYATAVQYFQGQQGWPMSLFLTPEGKPFYGGGYYSYDEFQQLLETQKNNWKNKQPEMIKQAKQLIAVLQQKTKNSQQGAKLDEKLRRRAIKDLLGFADGYHGGFGESQKFPREPWLFLLLDDSYQYANGTNNDSFTALTTSLDYMARGGIYDQLGGGFHRYTIDPYWQVPHFEKMLYNQALLVQLYLSANQLAPDKNYLRVVEQTLHFVLSQMQSPQGGFYSALDADTEGKEGFYYLWDSDELSTAIEQYNQQYKQHLNAQFAASIFDVDEYGEISVTGEQQQKNVLYLTQSPDKLAEDFKMSVTEFYTYLDQIRQALLNARNQRPRPERDEKIIMSWNAMMIEALARSSRTLENPQYLASAIKTAEFIWYQMSGNNNKFWYRTHFKNKNSKPAQLDDYAYFLQALITLFDMTQRSVWLERAQILFDSMLAQLWDTEQGGFFQSPVDNHAPLPVRNKSAFDKILPSANAMVARMLLRLERRTGNKQYKHYARTILAAFANDAVETPSAFSTLHIAARELRSGERQLPVYGAGANIRIDAIVEKNNIEKNTYKLTVSINLNDQWHINAHQPLEEHLIATHIELSDNSPWQLLNINYPQYDIVKLGFNDKPLALYQGKVKITALLKKRIVGDQVNPSRGKKIFNPAIKLSLQACSNDICLLPETFLLFPEIKKINH